MHTVPRPRGAGLRMSEAITRLPIRASLAGRWQVPVLALGIAVFFAGISSLAAHRSTLSFEDELERIRILRSADALTRASAYTLSLLQAPERTIAESAVLHTQLAGIIHQAEAGLTRHNPRNVSAIISNYEKSLEMGAELDAAEYTAWGDAYRWSERPADAVRAYRQALARGSSGKDRLLRLITELTLGSSRQPTPEVLPHLEAVLADSTALPGNYLWAMELKVDWLTRQGDLAGAMAIVSQARDRLSGTEERLAVAYSEAMCLRESGLIYAAQDRLHELRASWRLHDELWARSGWMLGQLEQEDGRPQAALNYYEEVLRAFQSGDMYDLCIVGRAECLAALARYRKGLEVFTELRDRLLSKDPPPAIDSDAVRVMVTNIGDSLVQEGRLLLAADYMELGQSLVNPKNSALRATYVSRRAQTLVQLARRMAEGSHADDVNGPGEDADAYATASSEDGGAAQRANPDRARELYVDAAEQYLLLADLYEPEQKPTVRALEAAADLFDSGGRPDRMVATLARLVREYPTAAACGAALLRMARAHHAENRLDAAIRCYRNIIDTYPRTPPALQSIVPLAECLLATGGESAREGEQLLIDLLEDRGLDPIFSPRAMEYRQALIQLAEYYVQSDADEIPDHVEKAIGRLEDAIRLYPDDPQIPRLRFLLADAYRASAEALRDESRQLASPLAQVSARSEADERMTNSLEQYERVIALLAGEDAGSLSELARSYLRASYLYRGDCLFDLGRYSEAIAAYHEAAWRFENLPTAIVAMWQVVHCHERLGELENARAALARLGWLLKKTPPSSFEVEPGMSSKAYWEGLIARMERTGL